MNSQKQVIALIKSFSGQANVLTIPRAYVDVLKSHRAALLLSQCVYWSDKTGDPDGWFYKTFNEWNRELGMNQHAIDTARKLLENLGLVETKIGKVNGTNKNHWRVDFEKLADTLTGVLAETANTHLAETAKTVLAENAKSTIAKITTKTTSARKERAPTHPAILTFQENAKAFPSKAQWPAIESTVGDSPPVLAFWGSVVSGYILCGWNPRNVSGMLEFFKRGEIPRTNGNGKHAPATQEKVITAADVPSIEVSADERARALAKLNQRLHK